MTCSDVYKRSDAVFLESLMMTFTTVRGRIKDGFERVFSVLRGYVKEPGESYSFSRILEEENDVRQTEAKASSVKELE